LTYHISSNARQGFPLNLALKYVKLSSICVGAPNWITQNLIARSQTKACITKLSCEVCALLDIMQHREVQ